ncbi:MAG: hypothetical protein F4133_08360 [Gammaproteobacteria bacterium]|nr:hypothetical protein [Gammaproteobacteria bacterium]
MKGDSLPDGHHVVRYVGGSKIDDGIVHPDGFRGQTSVNWLECVDGKEDEQLERIRSLIRLNPGATAKLAVLKVQTIRTLQDGLTVEKDPLPAKDGRPEAPCHANFSGLPESELDDGQQLRVYEALADSVLALHPAR